MPTGQKVSAARPEISAQGERLADTDSPEATYFMPNDEVWCLLIMAVRIPTYTKGAAGD
jgi:hypothetical protein